MFGNALCDIDSLWWSIYSLFFSYTIMIISLSCIFETEMHMFRTGHGMAAAQISLDIIYTDR